MRVDITSINQTKGASLFAEGKVDLPEELAPGLVSEGPAAVRVTVTNTGRFLHAEGQVDLRIRAACVRCLDEYELALSIPLAEDYLEETKTPPADPEQEFFLYSGTVIELDPAVTACVFLALPMKTLCREDCPGLCPHCGHNLKLGPCACLAEGDRPGPLD